MLKKILFLFFLSLFLLPLPFVEGTPTQNNPTTLKESYWFVLHRKSNKEYLYKGLAGDKDNSRLLKVFQVKSGKAGVSPTPLPDLLGRQYWLITGKELSKENPETAPYFLTLDIPVSEYPPYGPSPYEECPFGDAQGKLGQCNWRIPGYFGLHGVNAEPFRLSDDDPGSSGCVRHRDEDITYLYNILSPEEEEIRYYILDI